MHRSKILAVAMLCHAVNAAYCASIGDTSQVPWDVAPSSQQDSAIAGVEFLIANPEATPKDQHDAWMAAKLEAGWSYGEVKDEEAKTHPCIVLYDQLPEEQRVKDDLFQAVVRAAMEMEDPWSRVDELTLTTAGLRDTIASMNQELVDSRGKEMPPPEPGHRWVQVRKD